MRRGPSWAAAVGIRLLALAALATLAALTAPLGAPSAARAQSVTWADRCAVRLERASRELSAIAPWAGGGTVEITPFTSPYTGILVTYDGSARDLHAMIEDYPGTTLGAWMDAGLGECPDESERPPDLHRVRNYAGRQAQITIGRVGPGARRRIAAVLEAALDECATY